jgi:hypothetical protein
MSSPEPVDRDALAERLFIVEPPGRPAFAVPWAQDEDRGIVCFEPEQPRLLPRRKRGSCPKPLRELIIARDGICQLCGEKPGEPSIDRIIPGSMGGKYVEDNCQLACRPCNVRKGSQLVEKFAYAWWADLA